MRSSDADRCYSDDELRTMLAQMRAAAIRFYANATETGCHPFVEFTGLMNEYVKCCEATLAAGRDFTRSNVHAGGRLEVQPYNVEYFAEKLECILGPTLAANPELAVAFARRVTGLPLALPARASAPPPPARGVAGRTED